MTTLPEDVRTAIDAGVAAAQQAIRDEESKMGEMVNGWQVARDRKLYRLIAAMEPLVAE